MSRHWRVSICACSVVTLLTAGVAQAIYIDVDPTRPGRQTVSWAEPTTIMVFIPGGLTGADRMNFEMGIQSVADMLAHISVQFKDGEPPEGATDFIDVDIVTMTPPPYSTGGPFAPTPFPAGTDHALVNSGSITIDPGALGHAAVAGDFMKNIGAHEFGHVLGLDDDLRQGGARTNVMDADFRLTFREGQVVATDPFITLSERDKMTLDDHYKIVPEPTTAVLGALSLAAVSAALRHRTA